MSAMRYSARAYRIYERESSERAFITLRCYAAYVDYTPPICYDIVVAAYAMLVPIAPRYFYYASRR